MFLKMRVPFFQTFDKKTIRLIMERINCNWVNRNQVVCRFKDSGEQMYVLITGQVGEYIGIKHNAVDDAEPDEIYEPVSTFGEDNL